MNATVFCIVLFAAALHASWNAIVKRGGDTLLTTILVTGSAALIAAVGLPFLPPPSVESWPFIAASSLFQIAYFVLVARTYRIADMSLTYPMMRGTAPLLVALASLVLIGEPLSQSAWLGVGIICAGILSMAGAARSGNRAGVALALGNAVVIAGYTLIDGIGVRRSGAAAAYTLWIFLLTGVVLVGWALFRRRAGILSYAGRNWAFGLLGGTGTIGSYGLALWAMTVAPVAVVAALRETSILFGVAIAALILREKVGLAKIIGVCVIAVGAGALRLS
ncbi:EamA-like transporter family protein [Novosphingobium sp. PhB165]|uniref:EamA family transporter n=1 Tax=Novosphingobium sp. PhB165 TaxID=2485105 RepID=UPI001049C453|nr:EamA family transporter [Novosphingobium sp. PhB165]TCM14410.1 EamA-like transporter family protein [Novosphingobium sp. PhB165]